MPATLYLGRTGSGKTTLMRSHVAALIASSPETVFLIVNHGERPGHPTWRDLPGARIYRTAAEWWHDPARVAVFEGMPGRDVAELAVLVGWSAYVDDECDDAVRDGWMNSPLREIVKRGRHLANRAGEITNVECFLATHRPANLPTDVIGTFSRVYVGRLEAWNDCDRVLREAWLPECRTAQAVQDALRPLAPDDPNAPGPRNFRWYPA